MSNNSIKILIVLLFIYSCGEKEKIDQILIPNKEKIIKEFGFTLNNFNVKKDTVNREILLA